MPDLAGDAAVEAFIFEVSEAVKRDGFTVHAVVAGTQAEGFAYTIGLTAFGRPELWIGGLESADAARILTDLGRQSIEKALPLDGTPVADEGGVPFRLRGPVAAQVAQAYVAAVIAPGAEVAQVMWADPAGRYPDAEGGYDLGGFPQRVLPRLG